MNKKPIEKTRGVRRQARLFVVAAAGLLLVILGGGLVWTALPEEAGSATTSTEIPKGVGFEQKLDSSLPGQLTFLSDQGESVELQSIMDGKPVVLNLVYFECPMLCNLSLDGLVRTLNTMKLRVGKDFQVVTVSFDPREGPELAAAAKRTVLSRYGKDQGGTGWHFLTGDEENIGKLTEAVGFGYEYDEQSGQYAHAAGVVVLTPEGRISRYVAGVDYAARDLRLSLVEASAERIGSVTDQALLLCYRYDPLTGKYGLAISRAIQFAGFLTIAALVGSISWALRREVRGEPANKNSSAAAVEY